MIRGIRPARLDINALVDDSQVAVVVVDELARIVFARGALLNELGWDPAHLAGKLLDLTLLPEAQPRFSQGHAPKIQPRNTRQRIKRADGTLVELTIDVSIYSKDNVQFEVYWMRPPPPLPAESSVRFDPDHKIRAAQLKSLIDHLPVGVAYFDRNINFVAGNVSARRMLHITPPADANAEEVVSLPAIPELWKTVEDCIELRVVQSRESIPWGDPPNLRYFDWRFEPVGNPDSNHASGAIAIILDVTERTIAQRTLQRAVVAAEAATRRKNQFLAALSHDLRTPASSIRIQLELIQTLLELRGERTGELFQAVQLLEKSTRNLNGLLDQMINISSIDSDLLVDRPSLFSLDEWLETCLAPLSVSAQSKGLDFVWRVGEPGLFLRADAVKLTRILTNLVENAVKFTDTGSIDVSARVTADQSLQLAVRDTGPGIPPEQHQRIFDEFVQLQNPERDPKKGNGLGLAICRLLVEAAGGVITVESRPGEGSTFLVRYPLTPATPAEDDPIAEATPHPTTTVCADCASILLVDADAHAGSDLSRCLGEAGYQVVTVTNAEAAAKALDLECPAAVLIDCDLPQASATEFLRTFRNHPGCGKSPVYMLVGDSSETSTGEWMTLNIDGILIKPVDLGDLIDLLIRHGPRPG